MRIKPSLTFFLVLILIPVSLFAQKTPKPGIDSSLVLQTYISPDSLGVNQTPFKRDSLLSGFENYNPLNCNNLTIAQQGNIGRPAHNLLFSPTLSIGFNLGIHTFDYYRYNQNTVLYPIIVFPFSEIYYVQGGKKEQVFKVFHTQNILKLFQVGADFRLINSSGSYTRQKSDITNLAIFAGYRSHNNQYSNKLTYINNIIKIQENGGIKYDSVFEQNLETNRKVIAVNLNNAENRIRDNIVQFYQELSLKKPGIDSISKLRFSDFLPLQIKQFTCYGTESYVYEDFEPGNTFYPVFPSDTVSIHDSILLKYIRNSISLNNTTKKKVPINYRLGFEQRYTEVYNGYANRVYKDYSPFIGVALHLPFSIDLTGNYKYLWDNNNKEIAFRSEINKEFWFKDRPIAKLSAYYQHFETNPSLFEAQYSSALFNWDNSFNDCQTNRFGVNFSIKIFECGYEGINRKGHIYFLEGIAKPWQLSETLNYSHVFGKVKLHYGYFYFDTKIDYQKINLDKVIHLPEIISQHSVYGDLDLFAHALHLQPGFDIFYVSSYYAPAYMPATRVYYEQTDKKLNDQIYADFFLRFRISRARIFIKYQHFNSLFGTKDYYMVPSYPMQDAGIKFGISWVFRDTLEKAKANK